MTCKIGFSSEAMGQIMMTGTVGFPRAEWVSLGLMLTPLSLLVPTLVEKYTTGPRPFDVFMKGVVPRIVLCGVTALLFMYAPSSFADDACTQFTTPEQCTMDCSWNAANTTCTATVS